MRFLEQFGANNRLTKSVLSDLQTPELLASCKALGLIGRLVTLWSMIERKDVHILDMNTRYIQLVEYSRNVNDHIAKFMRGAHLQFGKDTHVKRDCIYQSLMQEQQLPNSRRFLHGHISSDSCLVSAYLQRLSLWRRELSAGYLRSSCQTDVSMCAKEQQYAESVFGLLDHLSIKVG